jgi:hypothetical protein
MIVLGIQKIPIQGVIAKGMSDIDSDENERRIDEYIARKSRIVTAKEFEGAGKVLIYNKNKVVPNKPGKFGPVIEYTVRELSGIERVVNASAVSLINGLRTRLNEKPKGQDVPLLIKKSGTGTETRYIVEHANN